MSFSSETSAAASASLSLANQQLNEHTLVIVDTETTGLDYKCEKLIEIGAVRLEKGVVVDTFSSLINPRQAIRHSSFRVHGIPDALVADAPPIEEVLPKFLAFVGDLPYAAHNVVFDYSFINEACKTVLNRRFKNLRICTLEMYRTVFPEEPAHGLTHLLARFGKPHFVSHRALDDALQLASVYPRLRELYIQQQRWQFSQLDNVEYLLERYLRLQKASQVLQSEMADLKAVFKLHFQEGGQPVTASTGELLTCTWRRQFDYDEDQLWHLVKELNLVDRVCKLNVRTLDRILTNRSYLERLNPAQRDLVAELRSTMSQSVQVAIQKPAADEADEAAGLSSSITTAAAAGVDT